MATKNPIVFFELTLDGSKFGRVEFELFADTVPITAENFRALCTGEKAGLHFKGSAFHRIIPKFMAQGGDFTAGNGTGGKSIYGEKFKDENFKIKHEVPGLLSMANAGPNTNGSQFFVTYVPCPWLDGKHTVFGRIISGWDLFKTTEKYGSESGKPKGKLVIADCGEKK